MRRVSRRALLGGLVGSIAGLGMISTKPVMALAQSVRHGASVTYTRGQTLYSYKGMRVFTQTVDWSPNGNQIASTGTDFQDTIEVARIWDALTGNHVLTYTGDGGVNGYGVSTADVPAHQSGSQSQPARRGPL
jgi:WD40 repeat protein